MTLYVLGLTGFTIIHRRFMNTHHMFRHVGDGESRIANSAGLADFFMHLLSVFSDIVNTFFHKLHIHLRVCFMLTFCLPKYFSYVKRDYH